MSDNHPVPREAPEEDARTIATGSTLADISIRNHVFAWVLMFALIGFGTLCFTGAGSVFQGLGISQNPDVDFPLVNVSVTYEGASPEVMETDVVDTIEDVVTSVEGVKQISSSSRQGAASINIEFELSRNIDVQAFANLVLTYRSGAPVRLKDVAVVEDGLEDRRRIGRTLGQPSIGMGITKLRGANAVAVGRAINAKTEAMRKHLPEGLTLVVNWDTTIFVEHAINEILFTLVLASVLTGLVCWVFLGSWSTTVNVLLAIPTSILGTFIVIFIFGFTLNTFTVLGLTLVVGIVVDDAIMVLENIYRHREHGEGKIRAASVGAREITFAAAAATFAIVAIFLPAAFMKGIIGKFFFQFGVTISVTLLLSLLEALTLAPMRCSRFLEVGKRGKMGRQGDLAFARLSAPHSRWLNPGLHHPGRVIPGAAA